MQLINIAIGQLNAFMGYLNCLYRFVGGNLGLFTGMSILSMCEIVFWIARIIERRLNNKMCKSKVERKPTKQPGAGGDAPENVKQAK